VTAAEADRFINFGVLGIVVLLFIGGWIVTGTQYRRIEARNQELHDYIVETLVPLIESTTHTIQANTEVMQELLKDRRRDVPKQGPKHG